MKRFSLVLLALLTPLALADGHKTLDWDTALSGAHRTDANIARNTERHPRETLEFFGLQGEKMLIYLFTGSIHRYPWLTEHVGIDKRNTRYGAAYRNQNGNVTDSSTGEYEHEEQRKALTFDTKKYYATTAVTQSMIANDTRQSPTVQDVTTAMASMSMQDPPSVSRQPNTLPPNLQTPVNRGLDGVSRVPGTGRDTFYLGVAQSLSSTPMNEGGVMYYDAEHKLKASEKVSPLSVARTTPKQRKQGSDSMRSISPQKRNVTRVTTQSLEKYFDQLRQERIQQTDEQITVPAGSVRSKMAIDEWLQFNPSAEDQFVISVIQEGTDWKAKLYGILSNSLNEIGKLEQYIKQTPKQQRETLNTFVEQMVGYLYNWTDKGLNQVCDWLKNRAYSTMRVEREDSSF